MSADNDDNDSNKKIKVDPKKTWGYLVTKHPLRYKIWSILDVFGEMNVTELSSYVKESKSTVSRYLIQMENDGLIQAKEEILEKKFRLPKKFYKINPDLKQSIYYERLIPEFPEKMLDFINNYERPNFETKIPEKPEEFLEFLKDRIREQRLSIKMTKMTVNQLTPLLDKIEKALPTESKDLTTEDLKGVKELWEKNLCGKNEPLFISWFLTPDETNYLNKMNTITYLLFLNKFHENRKRNFEEGIYENAYSYYQIMLPIRKILSLKKKS